MHNAFIFFSNRASALYRKALEPFGGREYTSGDTGIDLLYFDGYGGKSSPPCDRIGFRLIDRRLTIPLDNKLLMARKLMAAGVDTLKVYFDVDSVPATEDSSWFVKNPLATAGRDLFCLKRGELSQHFKPGYIIQEAVEDIDLIEGRKYTIRAYVLVANGAVYLFPDAVVVIHGKLYDPEDRSPEAQFLHEGYNKPESPVEMRRFATIDNYEAIYENLKSTVAESFSPFSELLLSAEKDTYCLFGLDIVVRDSFETVLIEINDRPNLSHTAEINKHVNIPVIQAMAAALSPTLAQSEQALEMEFSKVLKLG